jgi:hypothetical protein
VETSWNDQNSGQIPFLQDFNVALATAAGFKILFFSNFQLEFSSLINQNYPVGLKTNMTFPI